MPEQVKPEVKQEDLLGGMQVREPVRLELILLGNGNWGEYPLDEDMLHEAEASEDMDEDEDELRQAGLATVSTPPTFCPVPPVQAPFLPIGVESEPGVNGGEEGEGGGEEGEVGGEEQDGAVLPHVEVEEGFEGGDGAQGW